jgi:hypothetical protein
MSTLLASLSILLDCSVEADVEASDFFFPFLDSEDFCVVLFILASE